MQILSFKFILLKERKNGTVPIYLRITIGSKQKRYSLKMSCLPDQWSIKRERFTKKDKISFEKNLLLDKYVSLIKEISFNCQLENKEITFLGFERAFFNKEVLENDFVKFAEAYIDRNKNNYSKGTLNAYKGQLSKFKRFAKEIDITDIDVVFIEKYFNYLLKGGNMKNTAYKSTAFVKVILRQAIKEEIITKNPFDNFKIKKVSGNRAFLTKEELQKFEEFYHTTNSDKLKKVCRHFLFSCRTGLRYSDVKFIKKDNIVNDVIEIKMHKTKDFVRIPLSQKAKALIPKNDSIYLFNTMSNQKTNQYLKEIAKELDIRKELTFHVARHTFATLAIGLEIPIEVISKVLGHRDIKTTQIYSKIIDEVKLKHLSKFDEL